MCSQCRAALSPPEEERKRHGVSNSVQVLKNVDKYHQQRTSLSTYEAYSLRHFLHRPGKRLTWTDQQHGSAAG